MTKVFLRVALAAACGLWILGGCVNRGELRMNLGDEVKIPPRRVIVFFVDGLQAELTERMIRQGQLPNITKYLYDRGCHVDNAVTCIPSITYAAIATMATGRFPGHHQIMGNKWFDRMYGRYQDYMFIRSYQQVDQDLHAPTVYEMLGDKYTVTIQTAQRRGATRPFDNWMSSGINWCFDNPKGVDELVALRFEEIASCSRATGRWPDYIFAYFPAVDHIGHHYGSDSKQYQDAIVHLDGQIGRICRGLEQNGILKDCYLVLVSDHGHEAAAPGHSWEPEDYLENQLKVHALHETFLPGGDVCQWHAYLQKYRVALINGGPRVIHFFLRTDNSWMNEPAYEQSSHFLRDFFPETFHRQGGKDLVELLAAQPSVGMVTIKERPGVVRVLADGCEGQVIRKVDGKGEKTYQYKTLKSDPLGYVKHPPTANMVNTGFHSADAWLKASCDGRYPDFVPQVVEMYDSIRAGQITAFAARGWDFSKKDHGGHGSVHRGDMIIPFVIAGPGIRPGRIATARNSDLVPTVMDMLGCVDRLNAIGPIDGKSILPALKSQPSGK